ncbi:MAG TPA: tetratricopeptide repeat protein [Gammaproteobacteria bacterium]|nr:tetratricopeptide repeat protein [Gammaproteobacteria bacterium]
MSARSGNHGRLVALAITLAAVAACSSGGSRPASVSDRGVVEPIARTNDTAPTPLVPTPLVPPVAVPERAAAAFSEALAAMAGADWLAAEMAFEDLTRAYPAFPGPWVNLAILYRRDGRDEEAQAALEQALALAPDHAAANNELGVLHREHGEFAEAEAAYRRALEADPTHALAHYNLGVLLDLYLKREGEALEHYEAYQSLTQSPDEDVGRWIVDLRRRLGLPAEPERVAREN